MAKNFQSNPVEASINAFLISLPGRKIVVDTGAGQLFGPGNGGRLIESLATQGIHPQDITDILLTHAHSDHAGGMVKDGQRVLPRRMLQRFAQTLDIFEPPLPLQPIVISMYWHPKNSHDPANVWLRAQLLYAAGLQP